MRPQIRQSLIEIVPNQTRPTALPDHIYAVLKQRILSCTLPPNQRLVEMVLCQELGVSRTPLREALNRLSHEELVTFQPHAGYRVAPVTIADFEALVEFRTIVEPPATGLAATKATDQEIEQLRTWASLPFDPSDDSNYIDYCRANARFHLGVVRCARNPMLENVVMSALDMYQRPTYLRIGRQMDAGNPTSKHHAIVDAIAARDGALAQSLMEKHIRGGGDRILTALRAAGYK